MLDLETNTIYLMGGSFVMGSMCTLLLLLLLDFMREMNASKPKE